MGSQMLLDQEDPDNQAETVANNKIFWISKAEMMNEECGIQ